MNHDPRLSPTVTVPPDDPAEEAWRALSEGVGTLRHEAAETIRPADASGASPISLPILRMAPQGSDSATSDGGDGIEYAIGKTLGEGGMGIVRLAEQRSLRREVVVKRVRDSERPEAARRLLEEAWITGRLEHPNIVPVHELGLGADGSPVLVMKRIDGVSWLAVLR